LQTGKVSLLLSDGSLFGPANISCSDRQKIASKYLSEYSLTMPHPTEFRSNTVRLIFFLHGRLKLDYNLGLRNITNFRIIFADFHDWFVTWRSTAAIVPKILLPSQVGNSSSQGYR